MANYGKVTSSHVSQLTLAQATARGPVVLDCWHDWHRRLFTGEVKMPQVALMAGGSPVTVGLMVN